jgi:hypothetical protein
LKDLVVRVRVFGVEGRDGGGDIFFIQTMLAEMVGGAVAVLLQEALVQANGIDIVTVGAVGLGPVRCTVSLLKM